MPAHEPRPRTATVRCPCCARLNRVDLARLADLPKCAECQRPLRLDRPLQATDHDFEESLRHTGVPVVADFHAEWCGPCHVAAPVLDEFANTRAGEVLVLKVDSDRNPVTAARYGVRSIPTFIAFKDGRETRRHSGVPRMADLVALAGLE